MSTFCSYYNQAFCRSCSWIELSYEAQLQLKEKKVQELLSFMGPFALESTQGSATAGFRNRAKMSVTGTV